ncbi:hypothetical protein CWS72_22170 [Telmatospirillum siberiense]|uniref:Uncharacterized protein n=2 Tax=Telmatospirillum siberiense TaxID=382514 RepID=A0A2N3PPP2_9PROT|nr:hypothetical protein CWS72_22170 [Telmatospirillum siberiense]
MAPETVMAVLDTRLSGTDFAIDIREKLRPVYPQKIVMPGLEPGIHVPAFNDVGRSMQSWIAGSSPAMTVFGCGYHSNASTAQTVPDSRVLDTAYHVVGANDGDLFGGVDARLKAGHGVF